METCENCGGSGFITVSSTCHLCSGTAEVICYDNDGNEKLEICSNCEDGLVYTEQTCRNCRGAGEVIF